MGAGKDINEARMDEYMHGWKDGWDAAIKHVSKYIGNMVFEQEQPKQEDGDGE